LRLLVVEACCGWLLMLVEEKEFCFAFSFFVVGLSVVGFEALVVVVGSVVWVFNFFLIVPL